MLFRLLCFKVKSCPCLTLSIEAYRVLAITEDENEISLRDASHTRERPRLDGFDMDEDTVTEIEVTYLLSSKAICSKQRRNLPSMLMWQDSWTLSSTHFTLRRRFSLEKSYLMPQMLLIKLDLSHFRTLSFWVTPLNLR